MGKKEGFLESSEIVKEEKKVIEELTPTEAEEYFKGKVVWHLFRIIFDMNNDGGLREYIETAERVIISNINDICSGNYEFALDENLYLWSESWELRKFLLMIAIYCKELTLKEWQGEDPEKKLRSFFYDIMCYFDELKDSSVKMGDRITQNEWDIFVFETECDEYLHHRLWPFIHYLSPPPMFEKFPLINVEID